MKQANVLKYLGTVKTADVRYINEVKCRIAQAKVAFRKLKTILSNISCID